MNAKVIAIALVAVLAIGGVAYFVASSSSDENTNDLPPNFEGRLMVFGNANNDDFLNEEDAKVMEEIISTGWDQKKYPYADADHDGDVDEDDIAYLNNCIEDSTADVWFEDWTGEDRQIARPIGNVVTLGYDSMIGTQILGKHHDVVGRDDMKFASLRDETLNATIYRDAAPVAKWPFSVDMGLLTNLLETTKVDVLLAGEEYVKEQEDQLKQLGITLINMNFMSETVGMHCMITAGFLFGAPEKAYEFAEFMERNYMDLRDKVDSIPAADMVECISTMGTTIVNNETDKGYGAWPGLAGSVSPVTKEILQGADIKDVASGDTWQLIEEFDVEYLVCETAFNYGNTAEDFASEWKKCVEKASWDKMIKSNYPNGVAMVNWHLFPYIGISYVAEFLHPEVFGEGYADAFHQEYINRFIPDLVEQNFDVTEHLFLATYDDVKAYL